MIRGTAPDPGFLSTAIEAVVRAGDLQMAKFGTGVRVEKKGAIDSRFQEASRKSLELKRTVEAVEHAESNLLQELEVRLVLVRTGVLPDPEAVRAIE